MLDLGGYEQLVGATVGPFRLDQFEQDALGPLYLASHQSEAGVFRIRLFPPPAAPQDAATFLERFERHAVHVSTLHHPYILPLVQYGPAFRGGAFAAQPQPSGRSLTTRIQRSGPLDVLTAGRYLDQIAAALEYAHEHNTLHRHLTTDSLLLQMDGQIAVADFGMRRLLELSEPPSQAQALRYVRGSCAPEQLTGERVERPADIYALGAVLYFLLTGHPVFTGNTPEELAEQHVRAPVPSLAQWRQGLPPALDTLIATAMAKQPGERFASPGALANAYHRIVSPNNPARVPFVVGRPSVSAPGASPLSPSPLSPPYSVSLPGEQRGVRAPSGDNYRNNFNSATNGRNGNLPPDFDYIAPPRLPPAGGRRNQSVLRLVFPLVAVALVVAVTLGVLYQAHRTDGSGGTTPPPVAITGQATFIDAAKSAIGGTNALRLVTQGLPVPPNGSGYYGWLVNGDEHIIPLGALQADDKGSYTLSYPADADKSSTTNLLAKAMQLEVTLESGTPTAPVGSVVLTGTFPPQAFVHIQHLLVAFPDTPKQVGLLVGALHQLHALDTQAQQLLNAGQSHDTLLTTCLAQSIVNILEGANGAHYTALSPDCPVVAKSVSDDGYGLLGANADGTNGGYISNAAEHAVYAITTPDATEAIHKHGANVQADLTNVLGWALEIHQDAVALLATPTDTDALPEMAALADNAYSGVLVNNQLQEPGVLTAYTEAQQMATLPLAPRS